MSICCKLVRTLAVVLLATSHIASQSPELNSTLYSTIDGAYVAFSNENITFTCIARGSVSSHIAWTSELYIGSGGRRIEFISANPLGTTRVMGDAVGVLVNAVEDDFIESQLYIRIQPTFPVASVNCLNIDAGTMTSIMFRLADNDTSVVCDKPSVCPGEAVTCVCATGSSNTLSWVIDRLEFTSNDPLQTRRSVNASGILTDRYNSSEIQVITSNLNVTASKDDTSLQIQCENVDHSTSNPVTISVLQNCPAITTLPVTEPDPIMGAPDDLSGAVGVLAAICVILVVTVITIVILAFVLWWGMRSELIEKKLDIANKEEIIKILKDDNDKMNEIISHLEKENEDLRGNIVKKDNEIMDLRTANGKLEKEIKSLNTEKRKLEKKVAGENDTIKELNKMNEERGAMIGQLEIAHRNLKWKVDTLTTEKTTIQLQLDKKQEEIEKLKKKLKNKQAPPGGASHDQSNGGAGFNYGSGNP